MKSVMYPVVVETDPTGCTITAPDLLTVSVKQADFDNAMWEVRLAIYQVLKDLTPDQYPVATPLKMIDVRQSNRTRVLISVNLATTKMIDDNLQTFTAMALMTLDLPDTAAGSLVAKYYLRTTALASQNDAINNNQFFGWCQQQSKQTINQIIVNEQQFVTKEDFNNE